MIGLIYGAGVLTIGEISGACINAFRYLGPALLVLNLNEVYIYVFGCLAGGLVGGVIYDILFEE